MTKEQCDDILVMLKACYPNFKLELNSKESKFWVASLIDLDFEKAFIAAQQLTKTSKWPPSIAEIREAYASLLLPDLVDAEQAWGIVVQAINKHGGIYSTDAAMNELPRQVQEAVKWIGGIKAISQADKPDVLRGQFTKAMDAVNKRITKELALGPKLGNQIDNIRLALKEQEERLKLGNIEPIKKLSYEPVSDDSTIEYNIKQCGMLREVYAKAQERRMAHE